MENNIQEIRPIVEWGQFYFTRYVFHYFAVSSKAWQIEALKIIAKILVLFLALMLDILLECVIIFAFMLKKFTVFALWIIRELLAQAIKRFGFLVTYTLTILITISIAYLLFKHWAEFTGLIDKVLNFFYVSKMQK